MRILQKTLSLLYTFFIALMVVVFGLETFYLLVIHPSNIRPTAPYIYPNLREQLIDLPQDEVLGFLTSYADASLASARYRQIVNSIAPRLIDQSITCCRLLIADVFSESELLDYNILRRLDEHLYLVETRSPNS